MTAVCSPWWPVVRGSSQSRAGHFGGGQRGAPSDESRLIHLSLLERGVCREQRWTGENNC